MTTNLNQIENQTLDFLNENDPAVDGASGGVAEDTPVVKKKTATRKKAAATVQKVKKTPARRSRSTKIDGAESSPSAPAMKAFWGVFNPMMVQIAQYSYAEEAEARQAAADMTEKKKAPHFVQLIKKVI